MKKLTIAATALIFSLIIGFTYRIEILNMPMHLLIRDDQPKKGADYILIMMGGVSDRTEHAAKLLQEGYAKKIIFAEAEQTKAMKMGFRMPDGQATLSILKLLEVPDDKIEFLADSANTSSQEEVQLILEHIQTINPEAERLILVTSWFHSSRATWIIERQNTTPIKIESLPTPPPATWWGKESDFLHVFTEYLKWTYYLLVY
ncbi:YdcF family protein [Pseudobacteriovorax antillogorgiicola]|uniref:DUF218 domain-containing protein n=1 Tax=Pseudobacteriovorax antillogorgiicola TaxID=1513793 RepID=A0A1Y6CPG7_9BACT|nr:YdcF family protein [Pseudobacteriovorax antillogorgiicola]TCS46731.1 DUF218 domain-containing protein [Pseudobacteriovorax antillogorgiicola]SMF67196.1 DUF218 domain-containing protein [Pseudobacteriovorax antillogorgiicola]